MFVSIAQHEIQPIYTMEKDFQGFNHGKKKIHLNTKDHEKIILMKPTEIHIKEDGDLNNNPSVAIVMTRPLTATAVGEISLRMLNEGLADIGYEIKKIEK